MSKCILVCSGDLLVPQIPATEEDLVIACDAGVLYCEALSVNAGVFIGDMDSIDEEDYDRISKNYERELCFDEAMELPLEPGENIMIRLPREKDDTDTMAAVRYGLSKGYEEFHIYAGTGGYMDHTMANIAILNYLARQGARGYIWDEGGMFTVIRNSHISLRDSMEGRISVFPIGGPAIGVSIKGLQYELEDAKLDPCFPLGVSNSFTGAESTISVRDGSLLIMMYWE